MSRGSTSSSWRRSASSTWTKSARQSLGYIRSLSGPEIANVQARIGENALVVGRVQRSLADRVASYRFALERLVIAVPSPMAVEVDRSIALLQTRIAGNVLVPAMNFGVSSAAPRVVSK